MQEINLYHLLKFYAKKWLVIIAFVLLGALIGWIYTAYIQKPLYKSDATLLLVSADRTASKDSTRINNYIELFKSRRVLEPVIRELHLDTSYDDIVGAISAKNSKDTEVISVSIASTDRERSKRIASEAIVSFKKEVKSIYETDNVQVVDDANMPDRPYNVNPLMQITLATAAGFFLAIIALFFVYDYRMSRSGTAANETPEPTPAVEKESYSLPLLVDAPEDAYSSSAYGAVPSCERKSTVRRLLDLLLGTQEAPTPAPPLKKKSPVTRKASKKPAKKAKAATRK